MSIPEPHNRDQALAAIWQQGYADGRAGVQHIRAPYPQGPQGDAYAQGYEAGAAPKPEAPQSDPAPPPADREVLPSPPPANAGARGALWWAAGLGTAVVLGLLYRLLRRRKNP